MYYLVVSTIDNKDKAKEIANYLIKSKLSSCVNIVENVSSIYEWKGEVEEAEELILFIKTNSEKIDKLMEELEKLHPYEVPEIIAAKIEKGNRAYLSWISETLKSY